VVNHTLEVTNCFPFPSRTGEPADDDEGGARFQIEMLKCLREVNVDHLQVGWYQTTPLGSYLTEQLIQTQYEYQKQIEESVVLIYDPVRTAQGTLSLRAFRLSNSFMDLWKEQTFSAAALREKKISYENVFKEVKVLIRTSHMARALLYELEDQALRKKQEQLDISSSSFLERNVRSMMDCVDELAKYVCRAPGCRAPLAFGGPLVGGPRRPRVPRVRRECWAPSSSTRLGRGQPAARATQVARRTASAPRPYCVPMNLPFYPVPR